jgi:hypothetical protein
LKVLSHQNSLREGRRERPRDGEREREEERDGEEAKNTERDS